MLFPDIHHNGRWFYTFYILILDVHVHAKFRDTRHTGWSFYKCTLGTRVDHRTIGRSDRIHRLICHRSLCWDKADKEEDKKEDKEEDTWNYCSQGRVTFLSLFLSCKGEDINWWRKHVGTGSMGSADGWWAMGYGWWWWWCRCGEEWKVTINDAASLGARRHTSAMSFMVKRRDGSLSKSIYEKYFQPKRERKRASGLHSTWVEKYLLVCWVECNFIPT